jgi:hypothetical protein
VSLAASSVGLVGQPAETTSLLATFADSLYRSDDSGATWQPVELPSSADGSPASTSLVATAVGSSRVVVAAGGSALALSLDGGETWQAVPLPAPHARIVGAAASPEVARDRSLYAVVRATRIAPDGSLEAAGLELWRTDDLGQRWSRWLQSPAASVMTVVVPRPGDLDAALLVGHAGRVARPLRSAQETRRGERRPLWQEAQIGNPSASITALALSPHARRDGVVLAAADDRVYLSRDGGATFSAWDHRLAVPLVTALAVLSADDGHLDAYALGLGGTLWRRRL